MSEVQGTELVKPPATRSSSRLASRPTKALSAPRVQATWAPRLWAKASTSRASGPAPRPFSNQIQGRFSLSPARSTWLERMRAVVPSGSAGSHAVRTRSAISGAEILSKGNWESPALRFDNAGACPVVAGGAAIGGFSVRYGAIAEKKRKAGTKIGTG